MFHRLFACFALLTGLAAIGVPADAAEMEALSCQISASAEAATPAADTAMHRPLGIDIEPFSVATQTIPSLSLTDIAPEAPTVLVGIDRAYE